MMDPARGIRLRSSARTNTGKVRDNNEDNIHLWTSDQTALAIVADGMGGAAAGEEASRIAVEMIQEGLIDANTGGTVELLVEEDDDTLTDRMKLAIRSANMSIVQKADRHPEFKGMGTTVTMALVRNTHAVIGHVGDSRAYLIDGQDGHIIQVTSDHSFVQALVSAGHISEEEAEDHPMKNVLYRALGQARDVEVDIYYERLQPNDRLVLCSDGLTLHVRPEEIAQVVLAADNPEEASQKLIELANARGGRDNVSVIVIKVERDEVLSELEESSRSKASAYNGFDDDTLIIRKKEGSKLPFGSSESHNSPAPRERDGKVSSSVRSAATAARSTTERPTVTVPVVRSCPNESPTASGCDEDSGRAYVPLQEGRDTHLR